MKAKIITPRDWYANKVGITVQIKGCDFQHLWVCLDITTGCNRQIMKEDVEIIDEDCRKDNTNLRQENS